MKKDWGHCVGQPGLSENSKYQGIKSGMQGENFLYQTSPYNMFPSVPINSFRGSTKRIKSGHSAKYKQNFLRGCEIDEFFEQVEADRCSRPATLFEMAKHISGNILICILLCLSINSAKNWELASITNRYNMKSCIHRTKTGFSNIFSLLSRF